MIGKFKDPSIWGPHLAVAAAYAACYEVTRYFSFSHWMLTAGLRLSCLLLVPKRLWPALAVGEMLPIAEMAILHADRFGVAWASIVSFPPIALCMPAVGWIQKRTALFGDDGQVSMNVILISALSCALAVTAGNYVAMASAVMGDGTPNPGVPLSMPLIWFLGNFLGALTLTPSLLALRERIGRLKTPLAWMHIYRSSMLREIFVIEGPVLLALLLGSLFVGGDALPYFRMGMIVPVIVLTVRYGWHGAAVGGLLASVIQAATSSTVRDPAMIQAQALLAMVISTSLIWGARAARRSALAAKPHSRTGAVSR